ncbi:triphosphoribosyl-dephospho-CoA synthase CitG [Weissella viridescens]
MPPIDFVQAAERALLYEVTVNPKPGLVDPVSNGAHQDMDVYTFLDSAASLLPYLTTAVALAEQFDTSRDLTELFEELRKAGIVAEKAMFTATKGVNTHKGAVFSLGILVCATAYLAQHAQPMTSEKVSQTVQAMLQGLSEHDFARLAEKPEIELTAGERQFLKYGATGIRGQAEAGFPVVMEFALPYFATTTGDMNGRLLDTLMMISRETEDSNLIKRAGTIDILPWWRGQVDAYFTMGGSKTEEGLNYAKTLNEICIEKNLSLGGSADLLILTVYMAIVTDVL